jgi:hypothetical protein
MLLSIDLAKCLHSPQLALDNRDVPAFILDPVSQSVRYANPVGWSLVGHPHWVGMNVQDMWSPDIAEQWTAALQLATTEGIVECVVEGDVAEAMRTVLFCRLQESDGTIHVLVFATAPELLLGATHRVSSTALVDPDNPSSSPDQALDATLTAMARVVEVKDPHIAGRGKSVGRIAALLAEELGLTAKQCWDVERAGWVHDIGKIGVPTEIIIKPTGLDKYEYEHLKKYVETSYQLLRPIAGAEAIANIVRQHQERYDGSGYPLGLVGDHILLEARILGLADTLESMCVDHPYRAPLGINRALIEVRSEAGRLFDPDVVSALDKLVDNPSFRALLAQ